MVKLALRSVMVASAMERERAAAGQDGQLDEETMTVRVALCMRVCAHLRMCVVDGFFCPSQNEVPQIPYCLVLAARRARGCQCAKPRTGLPFRHAAHPAHRRCHSKRLPGAAHTLRHTQ